MGGRIFVGVSGFAYAEWVGSFYPPGTPPAAFLGRYAERLGAVELNHTLHRFPSPELVERWRRLTPAGFRFSLKVQRSITHSAAGYPKAEAAASFGRVVAPLGERLGPLLLDLPAAFKPDPGRLAEILAALALPAAVQFRDPGWLTPATRAVLAERGCVAATTEEEGLPLVEPAGPFAYFRLRAGTGGAATRLRAARAGGGDVYAFLRHSPEAAAEALALARELGQDPGQNSVEESEPRR